MASKKHASVVVIGAGPGGYAAAFRSADLGKDVLLIDREPALGGVCLNRGCIPSKALLHIARVMEEARSLNAMGVEFGSPEINIDSIREWKEKVIIQLNQGIAQMAKARKVETLQGTAAFKSNSELVVSAGSKKTTISFDHCIIAAGSVSASAPGISMDHPDILTSRTALDLEKIPETLLVIGGGYIGLEMGTVYHALGSKVSVAEFMPDLLPGADADLVKPLFRKLSKQFEEIALSTKITGVEPAKKSGLSVSLEKDGKTISREYDQVLMAVGRRPNTDHLQLGNTDIKTNEKNFITVDRKQKTAVDHIFAVGDCSNHPNNIFKQRLRLESVQNAVEQAKLIAASITGSHKPYQEVPWFWSDQYNIKLQIAGISQDHDHRVIRGFPEEEKFAVFYQKEKRLIAVDAINSPKEFMVGKKWIAMQAKIPFELIRNRDVDLKKIAG